MDNNYSFKIEKATVRKTKPNMDDVIFGSIFSDHMFLMEYDGKDGWHDGKILPYESIPLMPATAVFHYAQGIYEGMKAYRASDGRILLFRPDMNAKRLNMSGNRMCIPPMDEKLFIAAVRAVVDVDREWVPHDLGTSLYIRPFIIATGEYLGLRISPSYKFIIILSPVASYYKSGLRPTKVYIESEMSRSVTGGTGSAKCIGNYASTLLAEDTAHKNGYDQVLWLDGAEHKYIEEIGTANAFFVLGNEVWTASLDHGTILPGVTRASVIKLLQDRGFNVKETRISVEELFAAYCDGQLTEAFATGTASAISPVGELAWRDRKIKFTDNTIGAVTKDMYDTLTGIQYGALDDRYGWVMEV